MAITTEPTNFWACPTPYGAGTPRHRWKIALTTSRADGNKQKHPDEVSQIKHGTSGQIADWLRAWFLREGGTLTPQLEQKLEDIRYRDVREKGAA
jgi:hypothetical protein